MMRIASDRGVTALEFALLTPFILIMLLGTVDFSMETILDSALEHGAQAASRIGMTVSTTSGQSRDQAIADAAWYWVQPWLQDRSQLTIESRTYPAYSDIGQPEPCGDDSYKTTGTCTGPYTDVNGNNQWDRDMGSSGSGGYGAIVRYRFRVARPTYTGILKLVGIDSFSLERIVVLQNEPEASSQ